MTRRAFEQIVEEALKGLPQPFQGHLDNVVVCVETRPTLEQLKSVGLGKGDEILGLYEGIALTEKDVNDPEVRMPDRVWVFQEPIERMCRNRKEMVLEIQDTVIHEIGHHFGLDEDELEAIEDEYD